MKKGQEDGGKVHKLTKKESTARQVENEGEKDEAMQKERERRNRKREREMRS